MSDKDNAIFMAGLKEWERKATVKTVSCQEPPEGLKNPQIVLETEDGIVMVWRYSKRHATEFFETWDNIQNGKIVPKTDVTILRNAMDQNVAFYL